MNQDGNPLQVAFGDNSSTKNFPVSTIMDMGVQYGKGYLRENESKFFSSFFSPIEQMRPYFFINDKYVLKKLFIIFFPFRYHFIRKAAEETFQESESQEALPIEDPMAPDLYLPIVSFITLGLFRSFRSISESSCAPEAMFSNLTVYGLFWVLQMLGTKGSTVICSIPISIPWLDVVCWIGYIHVPMIFTALIDVTFYNEWKVALAFAGYFCVAWVYYFYRTLENKFCYTKRSAITLYVLCAIQSVVFFWLRARFFST